LYNKELGMNLPQTLNWKWEKEKPSLILKGGIPLSVVAWSPFIYLSFCSLNISLLAIGLIGAYTTIMLTLWWSWHAEDAFRKEREYYQDEYQKYRKYVDAIRKELGVEELLKEYRR
jgi:hypothetical protein